MTGPKSIKETARHKQEAAEYFKHLDAFMAQCQRLVDKGLTYMAVILCHELYRFIYPVEPYCGFTQTEPVTFILDKIKTLEAMASDFEEHVPGYKLDLKPYSPDYLKGDTLEKKTSDLYSTLWSVFHESTLWTESLDLVTKRLPEDIVKDRIKGKKLLDMGCGSGRYSLALARLGAGEIHAVDIQEKSFARARELANEKNLPIQFRAASFLELPFEDKSFDFVFSNGTLHHSSSIEKALSELHRVLKDNGTSFLYLYASGGVFWKTRVAMRQFFKSVPKNYTEQVLALMGMPPNRFIFCDTWYVPTETHTSRKDLEAMMDKIGFTFKKVISQNAFDLDKAIVDGIPGAEEMWGDGDHRYILEKKNAR